jgi:hypothetical protein
MKRTISEDMAALAGAGDAAAGVVPEAARRPPRELMDDRLLDEAGERGSTVFGPHAALEQDRVVAQCPQCAGGRLQVAGPAGEDEAIPVLVDGCQDVGDDLLVALVAGDEVLIDDGHPAGYGRAGASGVAVGGWMDVRHRRGASAWCGRVHLLHPRRLRQPRPGGPVQGLSVRRLELGPALRDRLGVPAAVG